MLIEMNGAASFTDLKRRKTLPVKNIPSDFNDIEEDVFYIVGNYVYLYNGEKRSMMGKQEPGIYKYRDKYMLVGYTSIEDKRCYDVVNVDIDADEDIEDIISNYIMNFSQNCNLMTNSNAKLLNTGDMYIPELQESDDALTRIMKLMIIHKKVIPANYKSSCDKDYTLDNLISALNGATASMTINRFLAWCEILGLKWEIELTDNGTDLLNPLTEKLIISDDTDLICPLGEVNRSLFKVPLKEGEDPLKRIIKVCIIKKNMCLVDYKHKGSTPHLLNNMRSSLKRDGRMMIAYFIYWCEVLGVDFMLRVMDPEDGTVFEADATYNAKDYMCNEVISQDDEEDDYL